MRAELGRKRLDELSRLDREIAAMDRRIVATVRTTGTRLTDIPGVGPFIAAKILGEVGDPSRVRSKAAFALLSGTAPLVASSGQTHRHRLNRGGNRQLNWALHYIALVQCRISPQAQAYVARQREAGKTHKEAIRCLKRQLSNVVYRHLLADAETVIWRLDNIEGQVRRAVTAPSNQMACHWAKKGPRQKRPGPPNGRRRRTG